MNQVQLTSLESYLSLQHKLGAKQKELKRAYAYFGPRTDREMATLLGWPASTVSARRNELIKANLVEPTGQRRNGGMVWKLRGWLPAREPKQVTLL